MANKKKNKTTGTHANKKTTKTATCRTVYGQSKASKQHSKIIAMNEDDALSVDYVNTPTKNNKLRMLAYSGILLVIVFLLSIFPHYKIPQGGYIHVADAVIIVSVAIIGLWALPAVMMGSFLADLALNMSHYSGYSFFIKGAMVLIVYFVSTTKKKDSFFCMGAVLAGVMMIASYFLADSVLLGAGYANDTLVFQCIQTAVGILGSIGLYYLFKKIELSKKLKLK